MRIYIARHGQTDWNSDHRTQGRTDIPLNETGKSQAVALAAKLGGVDFRAIYASPLSRAYETAVPTARAADVALIPDERLIERDFGDWEGERFQDLKVKYPEIWQQWAENPYTAQPPNAEPMPALRARCMDFLSDMAGKYGEDDAILAVCHSIPARMLIAIITNLDPSRLHEIVIENAGYQAFTYPSREESSCG